MQQLHLVGVTADHDGLIFSARRGAKSGGFTLDLDERLLTVIEDALRQQAEQGDLDESGLPTLAGRTGRGQSQLSPREIQSRLRSGYSIEDVAEEAGVDEAWIARFAAPILAEQEQVVARALPLLFVKPRLGESAQPLGVAVRWNLADRGLLLRADDFRSSWSAYQLAESAWVVRFTFVNRRREQAAEWVVDIRSGDLIARNRLASDLAYVEPGRRRAPGKLEPAADAHPPAGEDEAPTTPHSRDGRSPAPPPRRAATAGRAAATTSRAATPARTRGSTTSSSSARAASSKRGKATKTTRTGKATKSSKATKATKARKAARTTKATKASKATKARKATRSTRASKPARRASSSTRGAAAKRTAARKAAVRRAPTVRPAARKSAAAKKTAAKKTAARKATARKAAAKKKPARPATRSLARATARGIAARSPAPTTRPRRPQRTLARARAAPAADRTTRPTESQSISSRRARPDPASLSSASRVRGGGRPAPAVTTRPPGPSSESARPSTELRRPPAPPARESRREQSPEPRPDPARLDRDRQRERAEAQAASDARAARRERRERALASAPDGAAPMSTRRVPVAPRAPDVGPTVRPLDPAAAAHRQPAAIERNGAPTPEVNDRTVRVSSTVRPRRPLAEQRTAAGPGSFGPPADGDAPAVRIRTDRPPAAPVGDSPGDRTERAGRSRLLRRRR